MDNLMHPEFEQLFNTVVNVTVDTIQVENIELTRMLMYPRLADKNCVFTERHINFYGSAQLQALKVDRSANHILFDKEPDAYKNIVLSIRRDEEGLQAAAEAMAGYESIEAASVFISQRTESTTHVFRDGQNTYIISDARRNPKYYDTIAQCLPILHPEPFKDAPLTDAETDAIKSIIDAPEYFIDLLKNFYETNDFRAQMMHKILHSVIDGMREAKLNLLDSRVTELRCEIAEKEQQILRKLKEVDDFLGQILILKDRNAKSQTSSEVLDFLSANKSISLLSCAGSNVRFVVNTVLSNYDIDLYESVSNNSGSYFIQDIEEYSYDCTYEQAKTLFDAIFLEERFKIRVSAEFSIDFSCANWRLEGNAVPPKSYTHNPHIFHYSCFGGNGTQIDKSLYIGDYISAMSQIVSAVQNINFGDSAVGHRFIEDILTDNYYDKFLETPDGNVISPDEAIKILSGENNHE